MGVAAMALPSEALAKVPEAAPGPRRSEEVARSSQHFPVELGEVADSSDAGIAICNPACATTPPVHSTSVKILLGELRQKTDELRRMRFELEATQRMLYDSQATMEDVQAAKWRELSTAAVGCVGLAAGLRTYFKTSLSKINVEKKRALVGVEVEVQERLGGVMAEVVKDQVAERLADAVEAEIPAHQAILQGEQAARAAAQEALKQERAEKAIATARALDLRRQKDITQYRLFEAKRSLAAEQEAHAAAATERRLARVIIEARQAAQTERAMQRVRAEAGAAAERELALQRIVIEAQERRAIELRKEADDFRAEAAQLQQALNDMASSEKGHIDTLQKRAEQAAALRAAADADYKDVSTQLQAERFRVETLKQQAEQAAAERAGQGSEAGMLYQKLADQLEEEHGRVAVLEKQMQAAAEQRASLDAAYEQAVDALEAERSRAATLQEDLEKARSDLVRSEEEVSRLREVAASAPPHTAMSFSDEDVALLQTGLQALANQSSLPDGQLDGLLAFPSQVAKLANEVAALAEEVAAEEAAAAAEIPPVAGHRFELFPGFPMVDFGSVDLSAPLQQTARGTNGHSHGRPAAVVDEQPKEPPRQDSEVPVVLAEQLTAEVPIAGAEELGTEASQLASMEQVEEEQQPASEVQIVGEQGPASVEQIVGEQQINGELQDASDEQINGRQQASDDQPVDGEQQTASMEHASDEQLPAAAVQAPAQYSFWESQHTDVIPRTNAREWTDARFASTTLAAFPEKAVASAEEARCLMERGGYVYLDVRPAQELAAVGCVEGSFNLPVADSEWNGSQGQVVKRNENFIDQVSLHFPGKDTPLMIGCSDGCTYSIDALEALEEAGYSCLVGLKGGYNAWQKAFGGDADRRRGAAVGAGAEDVAGTSR